MPRKLNYKEWIILDKLADIILDNVHGCVVDIGIGSSTKILRDKTNKRGIKQYTCDIDPVKCKWARSIGCKVYEKKSIDFINEFDDPPIALLFIDGEHKVNIVMLEVMSLLPKMAEHGVIFLHDTYPPRKWISESGSYCGTVYKAREEIESIPDLQIYTFPFTASECGLSIIGRKLKPIHDDC